MESLTTQIASLSVIAGLNLIVSFLAWLELKSQKVTFFKYVVYCQVFITLWHLISIVLVAISEHQLFHGLSAATFFLFCFYYLSIALEKKLSRPDIVKRTAIFAGIVVFSLCAFSSVLRDIFWILNSILLLVVPVVSLVYFRQQLNWFVVLLQFVIFAMYILSVFFFSIDFMAAGGLFYVLMGIFQPILTVIFILSAVHSERISIARKESDFRLFFDNVNEVFFKLDANGAIQEVSESIIQFGHSASSLVGSKIEEYLSNPDLFKSKLLFGIKEKGSIEYTGAFKSRFGVIECEIHCTVVENSNNSVRLVGSIRNTHERNMLEKQFIESQRMESLGTLAGGIAHDFNNLLQGISGYSELLLENLDKEQDKNFSRKGLNAILSASTSAGALCNQLLHYSGRGVSQRSTLNLVEIISEVLDLLIPSCPTGVNIHSHFPESLVFIYGDRGQIGQVFMNLLKNAVEAVGNQGEINITVKPVVIDIDTIRQHKLQRAMLSGNYFLITISDSGVGIDHEFQRKIFDPFFTTKENGRGLGLSAVIGILRIHDGDVIVVSEPGVGTEFKIYLPEYESEDAGFVEKKLIRPRSNLNVLLVDDTETVLLIAQAMLEREGHAVFKAKDGMEALNVVKKKNDIDLVITDIKMPNMDGVMLGKKLMEYNPDLPVIYMSGFSDIKDDLQIENNSNRLFIGKPFRVGELLKAIADVMSVGRIAE